MHPNGPPREALPTPTLASALERVIALRIHIDDSTRGNGPLRVLPGMHLLGVLDDAQIRGLALRSSPQECCAGAGGIPLMRPLIIHASSKCAAPAPRRVLHIEYAASLEISRGIYLRAA